MQWFRPCSGLIGVVVKAVQWFRPCGGLNCAGGLGREGGGKSRGCAECAARFIFLVFDYCVIMKAAA